MPWHQTTCSKAHELDRATTAEAADDHGIVRCGCGCQLLMLRSGGQMVAAVVDLVAMVVVVIVRLIVVVRRLAPCRTPVVKAVLPPFHDVDHV